jgi:hypothetical protein
MNPPNTTFIMATILPSNQSVSEPDEDLYQPQGVLTRNMEAALSAIAGVTAPLGSERTIVVPPVVDARRQFIAIAKEWTDHATFRITRILATRVNALLLCAPRSRHPHSPPRPEG